MMIDYNSMSDFEINKRVAEAQGLPTTTKTIWNPHTWPEYCTSPSNAWPIISESGISIKPVACPAGSGYAWYAQSYCGQFSSGYCEPLRSAMIVYLMIKDSEND